MDWQLALILGFIFGLIAFIVWDAVAPLIRGGDDDTA